jgi:hypothetical protein
MTYTVQMLETASSAKLHRLSHLADLAQDWDLYTSVNAEITTRTWDRIRSAS